MGTSQEDIIHWQRTDDDSGIRSLTKAVCLGRHMCEKSAASSKLGTVYKGMQRAREDKRGPEWRKKKARGRE